MQRVLRASTQARQVWLGSLIFIAILLAGCGPDTTSAPRLAADQTFIWPLTHETSYNDMIVDPPNSPDVYSGGVINLVFGHLITTDHNLNVIPDMATSWEISPDGQQYTFHLRPGLHFSDGAPLTSQDFAYSLDRALDPQVCVPFAGPGCHPRTTGLFDIVGAADRVAGHIPSDINVGIFTPDALTLLIKLTHPAAHFLAFMTTNAVVPLERTFIEKYGVDHAHHNDWTYHLDKGGCSGPFIVQSYGKDGKTITFVPNPYWHGPKLALTKIIRPIILDVAAAYTGYQQGKYDYADVPPQEYLAARDQADFHEIGLLSEQFLGINELAKPFDDLRVRQAFALALNKQLIADRALSGAVLPTNHIVPQGEPGFYAGLTAPGSDTRTVTGDVQKAQALIKSYFSQCGCSSIHVTLSYPHPDVKRDPVAQAMIQMWQVLLSGSWGKVIVTPQPMSFATLVNDQFNATLGRSGPLQMWLIGLSGQLADPFNWLNGVFAPTAPLNVFNYRDVKGQFDAWALMQQADEQQNTDQRLSLYYQAEQQLVNAALEVPYAQEKGLWRIKSYIQGFNPTPMLADPILELDWPNIRVLDH